MIISYAKCDVCGTYNSNRFKMPFYTTVCEAHKDLTVARVAKARFINTNKTRMLVTGTKRRRISII